MTDFSNYFKICNDYQLLNTVLKKGIKLLYLNYLTLKKVIITITNYSPEKKN